MKAITMIMLLTLVACGKESSPEGRMQIKMEKLEQKIDILAVQNKSILDSVRVINQKLKAIKRN